MSGELSQMHVYWSIHSWFTIGRPTLQKTEVVELIINTIKLKPTSYSQFHINIAKTIVFVPLILNLKPKRFS